MSTRDTPYLTGDTFPDVGVKKKFPASGEISL